MLNKEVKEEVGLKIRKPQYLCDLVFIRPDGYPAVTLSYWCRYKSGKVQLSNALNDHAWVTLSEAKKYDLIDGIWDELKMVDKISDKKILSESESPKSGRAKGANGMAGVRPARRDARKSEGGMKEKERERSESLFWLLILC